MLVEAEEMTVTGDLNCPELPGPSVDVLEDVMVDGLKVARIEGPLQWLVLELANAADSCFGFELGHQSGSRTSRRFLRTFVPG